MYASHEGAGTSPSGQPPYRFPVLDDVQPGENAFAIEKRKAEEHRLRSNAFYAEQHQASLERSDSHSKSHGYNPNRDTSTTTTTTFSQVMNAAKAEMHNIPSPDCSELQVEESPPKPERSTPKERKRPTPLKLDTTNYGVHPTARAAIEAKNEKKLFQMMGAPTTPTRENPHDDAPIVAIAKHDRTREKSSTKNQKEKEKEKEKDRDREEKSPKKKFLGMHISMPNFRSDKGPPSPSRQTPNLPHMPPKAAALLGNAYAAKTRAQVPAHLKMKPSQTAISLPGRSKRASDPFEDEAPPPIQFGEFNATEVPAVRPLKRQNSRFRELIDTPDLLQAKNLKYINESLPPTPPAKDTPVLTKKQPSNVEDVPPPTSGNESGSFAHSSSPMHDQHRGIPAQPVLTKGHVQSGQPQLMLYTSQDYRGMMAKMSQIYSAPTYGRFGSALFDRDGSPVPFAGRWSEGQASAHQYAHDKEEHNTGELLRPTFYTPSLYSQAFPSPTHLAFRPSRNTDEGIFHLPQRTPPVLSPGLGITLTPSKNTIDVASSGDRDEITPRAVSSGDKPGLEEQHRETTEGTFGDASSQATSHKDDPTVAQIVQAMREGLPNSQTSSQDQNEVEQTPKRDSAGYQTSNSTGFGLTPLLNQHPIDSPMMRRYNAEPIPLSGSAVPSPLHPGPRPMPPDNMILADGSQIVTHFGVVNYHMDMIAESMFRAMNANKEAEIKAFDEHHTQKIHLLNEQFDALRDHILAVDKSVTRVSGEVESVTPKLNKLMDIIQKDLIRPLGQVLKTNVALEMEVKKLTHSLAELEAKVDKSNSVFSKHQQQSSHTNQQHQAQSHSHPQDLSHSYPTPGHSQASELSHIPAAQHSPQHQQQHGYSNSLAPQGHQQPASSQTQMSYPEWGANYYSLPMQTVRGMKEGDPEKFKNHANELSRMYGTAAPDLRNHPAMTNYMYGYPNYGGNGMK